MWGLPGFKPRYIKTHFTSKNAKAATAAMKGLGDCCFMAAEVALAKSDPEAIENLITQNSDGSFTARIYNDPSLLTVGPGGFYHLGWPGSDQTGWIRYTFTAAQVLANRIGQAAPMLDAVYRAAGSPGNGIDFKRVADNDVVKELTDDRNLIVVPVGTSVRFVFHHSGGPLDDTSAIEVLSVTGSGAKCDPRRARVSVQNSAPAHGLTAGNNHATLEFPVGGVLPLVLNCQLAVKKIVPPNEKRKILGWVEFSPDPPKKNEKAEKK
jgi:hypothetical protein